MLVFQKVARSCSLTKTLLKILKVAEQNLDRPSKDTMTINCPCLRLLQPHHMHLCPEMQVVTKMAASVTKFRQSAWRFLCKLHGHRWAWRVGEFGEFGDFYAIYLLTNFAILTISMQTTSPELDGSNVLANLMILAIFITSWVSNAVRPIGPADSLDSTQASILSTFDIVPKLYASGFSV